MKNDILIKFISTVFLNEGLDSPKSGTNEELDEVYSRTNLSLQKMFNRGYRDLIDVVDPRKEWGEICQILDNFDLIRLIPGINATNEKELKLLDPTATWEKTPNTIKRRYLAQRHMKTGGDLSDMDSRLSMEPLQDYPLPRQTWLIHYSDAAEKIAQQGFIKGFNDRTKLTATTHYSRNEPEKRGVGYNFAFIAGQDDWANGFAYGKQAVLFQSSGVHVYHDKDDENQVIFYGPEVNPDGIVWLDTRADTHNNKWSIMAKQGKRKGQPIFTGTPQACLQWVQHHFQQYRRLFQTNASYDKQNLTVKTGEPIAESLGNEAGAPTDDEMTFWDEGDQIHFKDSLGGHGWLRQHIYYDAMGDVDNSPGNPKSVNIVNLQSVPNEKKFTQDEPLYKRRGFYEKLIRGIKNQLGYDNFYTNNPSFDARGALKRMVEKGLITADTKYIRGLSDDPYPVHYFIK